MDAHSHPAVDPPCPGCGRRRTADARGLAWSSEHAPDGTVTFVCPACTRADIFRIEAGLPGRQPRRPAA
ncbi:MAG: hypothetical protein JNM77_13025 [Pseudonocardia sp.]|nr:hypothetical protein [Pseudonocardia sp.]